MRNSLALTTKPDQPSTDKYKIDTQPLVIRFKLNGDNYLLWAVFMQAAISGRGMVSHITGVPTPPSRTEPTFAQWQKLVNRVSRYPTAKDIWDSLSVTYASGGDSIQVFDLYRQASSLKQNDDTLEDIWNQLQDLWVSIDQKEPNPMESAKDIETYNGIIQRQRLYQLLIALNDKHETTKKEILRMKPLPSVEMAYAMIRSENTRSSVLRPSTATGKETPQGIGVGVAARRPWQNQPIRGSSGGGSGNWNKRPEEDRSKLVCTHCGRRKHTRETCFEIVGFSEWWEAKHGKPPSPSPSPSTFRGGRAATTVGEGTATHATVGGDSGVTAS